MAPHVPGVTRLLPERDGGGMHACTLQRDVIRNYERVGGVQRVGAGGQLHHTTCARCSRQCCPDARARPRVHWENSFPCSRWDWHDRENSQVWLLGLAKRCPLTVRRGIRNFDSVWPGLEGRWEWESGMVA